MNTARRNIMLGTAGHVDHGKTALVKLLTGCDTDTLAEEKQRGLTMDLGFAPCQLADQRVVGIVDVPGHVDFIRNMVAGAHGIDVVIFVVAADDGIMPQTHEHLHILTLMGLRHGLVALTKADLVDAARRESVVRDLRRLLSTTFLSEAPICPMSNVTGEGFDGFFDGLNQVVAACEDRSVAGWFRMWVEDTFTIRGSGTVITGIPERGRVRAGDHLYLLPSGGTARVRRMQVYGQDADEGRAGECVALNLPDLDHPAVRRGMLLSGCDQPAPVTMAEADLRLLDSFPGKLEDYAETQLHVGTAAVTTRLAMLETLEMTAGQRQMVQLRVAEPVPLAPGERFVLRANVSDGTRNGLATVGGGRILGISNNRLRRRPRVIESLRARADALDDSLRWCELVLREADSPLPSGEIQRRCLLQEDETTPLLNRLRQDGRLVPLSGGAWIHSERVEQTAERLLSLLGAFHAAHPERAGAGRDELRAQSVVAEELFETAVERLIRRGEAVTVGALLALAGWKPRVLDHDERMGAEVEERLRKGGLTPPSPEELAATLGEPSSRILAALRLLADRGRVARLDDRVWMHADAVESGKEAAIALFRRAPTFTTMDFRDALGVSRKFAVPLLDHLDGLRLTVRSGNHRTPGVEARKRLATQAATPHA